MHPTSACILHAVETIWDNVMSKKKSTKVITERAVRRAFARVLRKPEQLEAAVTSFMSGNPVPPAWGLGGVRAVFGRAVSHVWARHLRHLRGAHYLNTATGRSLFPVVQHMADLEMDARRRWRAGHRPAVDPAPNKIIMMDESWVLLSDPHYLELMHRASSGTRKLGEDLVEALLEATKDSEVPPAQLGV